MHRLRASVLAILIPYSVMSKAMPRNSGKAMSCDERFTAGVHRQRKLGSCKYISPWSMIPLSPSTQTSSGPTSL